MNNLVKINHNNQVTTDSLTVADRFGKRHCDVLRSIKMLKCSKEFSERNFALAEYLDEQGKPRTYYDMTYDGWMFLVMGFTGEKAAEWKEKFIVAFRAMEAKLKSLEVSSDKPVVVSEHTRALPAGKKEIVLSEKAREEIGGIVKAVVVKALSDNTPAVASQDLIADACKTAIAESFKVDIKNDNIFSLYKFVKSACRRAVREEVSKLLPQFPKTEPWEVSDSDLLFHLYRWHNTRNKVDTMRFRELHAQCDTLADENTDLKNRLQQISTWIK